MESRFFHVADYIVFTGVVVLSISIGIFHALSGGKQMTTSEYHLGNRRMSIIPVAISLIVSFESSIMMLGTPAEIYVFGIQNIMWAFGWFIANLLSIKLMVPLIHPLKITSAYEYLELRFQSHAVRMIGTMLGMIHYTIYMGIVLYGPAIALEAVMGFPQIASIVIVAVAAVIYTSVGGIKAVIWTDVFQSLIMVVGITAFLIQGTILSGGMKSTWSIANDNGRLNFFVTLSSGLSSLSALFWQDIVKPHTKPMSEFKATIISKVAVIVFGLVAISMALLVSIIGGTLTQIGGTILAIVGGPLTGLFLLGCFCPWANAKGAVLGTLSGIALITWIITGQYTSPNVRQAVPLPSAPIDKCYLPQRNISAMYNMTSPVSMPYYVESDILTTDIPETDNIPSGLDYFYSIAYPWFGVIGIFTVMIVGSIISFLTGYTKPEESNPLYLISAVDEFFFFLPKSVKKVMKFGYIYKKTEIHEEKNENSLQGHTSALINNSMNKLDNVEQKHDLNNVNTALLTENSTNHRNSDRTNGNIPLLSIECDRHEG
ncbi:Hypothetical predicted protein [Mytilus galloprovincialis]|uniref:Sodium-dependent multivitamin transporter n=1 Tax=Mytilus galloprovincialis TaxID=29158 RepID=A0A8B6EMI5_MYTGA|nr:Hypothetical predicted protein [Mytilus galloprovincialis]